MLLLLLSHRLLGLTSVVLWSQLSLSFVTQDLVLEGWDLTSVFGLADGSLKVALKAASLDYRDLLRGWCVDWSLILTLNLLKPEHLLRYSSWFHPRFNRAILRSASDLVSNRPLGTSLGLRVDGKLLSIGVRSRNGLTLVLHGLSHVNLGLEVLPSFRALGDSDIELLGFLLVGAHVVIVSRVSNVYSPGIIFLL